jgi:hypothetical protein
MNRPFILCPRALSHRAVSSALVTGLVALLAACGPSMEPGGIMTPEQRLQEEEMKAYEAEKAEKERGDDYSEPVETDEREEFDKKQAELEMKRASLSARTCVKVVEGAKATGVADVTVVFGNDGNVRDASIASPYADTPLGECVLNAYRSVIVPPFRESDFTLAWQLDFNPPPAAAEEDTFGDKKDDAKKDAKGEEKDAKKSTKK